MTNANHTSDVPVSNWTLATGTKPGERAVFDVVHPKIVRHTAEQPGDESLPADEPFDEPQAA